MENKTNKNIVFPYYSGNIRFTRVQGNVNLEQFIRANKNPNDEILKILNKIKIADFLNFKKLKRRLKHKLFSFTPSVRIGLGMKRSYGNVIDFTGLMQLDFDKIESIEIAKDLKRYLFNEYKFVVCSYLSPSGLGVKCLIKITKPKSKEHYKALHKAVTNELSCISYYDEATKNAMLPLFLSYDNDIMYRDYSECETFIKEDWFKINYISLNNKPKIQITSNLSLAEEKTIKLFCNKINSIVSDGHTQLRSACLILGSRSGASYINKSDAENLAIRMIDSNNYLQKDLNNYKSTAIWAINEGFKNPKYY